MFYIAYILRSQDSFESWFSLLTLISWSLFFFFCLAVYSKLAGLKDSRQFSGFHLPSLCGSTEIGDGYTVPGFFLHGFRKPTQVMRLVCQALLFAEFSGWPLNLHLNKNFIRFRFHFKTKVFK